VATGDLNFTSTQQLPPPSSATALAPSSATTLAPSSATVPAAPAAPLVVPSARSTSEQSVNPFSTNQFDLDGQETTSEARSVPAIQEAREGENTSRRKRKQSHIGAALEDYVEFKRSQINKTLDALKEKKKDEEQFSMRKCVNEMDAMDGLTDEEKSYAVELFESEINREAFMSTTNHNVRTLWLKRKIRYNVFFCVL
jgi:hypothetical protein